MATGTPMARLHGRAEEAQALGEALDLLASGRPAITLVEGEAGIGKTRLLTETFELARRRGLQIASGCGEELEATRPFGLVADALACSRSSADPRRAAIAELLAIHGAADQGPITVTSDPGLQFRAVDAFVDLVEELALRSPLLIGLDDLQWADPSSLLTISAIGRRLTYLPVALIGCYRPSPHVPQLQRVIDSLRPAARLLTVRRLSERAVSELVAEAVGAEPGPSLLREMAGAAGNPLFVTELLGAIRQEGVLATSDGRAEVVAMSLPPTLRLTILRRLSFLPEETLQALRAASILGSSFTLTDLSVSTARPAISLSAALTEAITAGVLADDGVRLRFGHDLIRDATYDDLPGSVRLALHREAGQRLAAAGAPAAQVAEHLARGALPGDPSATGWLTRAAREAAVRSPDVAADLLARAIELTDPADPGRDRLLAERAYSLLFAGRVADSEQACRTVLDRPHDPGSDGPARICLGHALLTRGHPRGMLLELERAGESALITDRERAGAQAWASFARLMLGDLVGASAAADQARAAAVTPHDLASSLGTATLSLVREQRGQLQDARDLAESAVRLARQDSSNEGFRFPVHVPLGLVLVELDRLDEARATLAAGIRTSEELGIRWVLGIHHVVRGAERFIGGDWDDAIAETEASLELAEETGDTFTLILGRSVLSLIALHRNELAQARQAAEAAASLRAAAGNRYRVQWALGAQALLLEADGKVADAFAMLADCWDQCTELGLVMEHRALGADLVRVALEVRDTGRARDVAASVTELAARNDLPSLTGAALRCQGLLEDDAEILQAAVAAYARSPRQLELALTAEDAGTALVRHGQVAQARPLLDQAVTIYERLDAGRDLARADALLRVAGTRRGRRGPRNRPRYGWQSLTDAEQTVATLVAEGLSNPQIGDRLYVSRRTVQTHLAHVFTKLDISSRAQLAAEVTRQAP
jgi:DNA-binding CsgD family transcriptional regulator